MTIHEHLNGTVSVRLRPACGGTLRGQRRAAERRKNEKTKRLWKSGNLANHARFPLSHSHDDYDSFPLQRKNFKEGSIVKPDRSRANKTGHLDVLTTMSRVRSTIRADVE